MAILLPWLAVAFISTGAEIGKISVEIALLLISIRSFLNTGLFIIAHDSMHNTLSPEWPRLNKAVGTMALFLYAGLNYSSCKHKHLLHHSSPETPEDPDYRLETEAGFLSWFFRFLRSYVNRRSLFWLTSSWALTYALSGYSIENVIAFSVIPLIISSVQLFTFGIWLPHRPALESDSTTPRSSNFPPLLSLITCYNFGYHREHHENPFIPWYQLPRLAAMKP